MNRSSSSTGMASDTFIVPSSSSLRASPETLPTINPKVKESLLVATPSGAGSRQKLRKLPSKSSSLRSSGGSKKSPGGGLFGGADSAPVLPDRAPEPTPLLKTRRVRSTSVFRAAEGGRSDVLPTQNPTKRASSSSLSGKSPLRSRRSVSSSSMAVSRSFSGYSHDFSYDHNNNPHMNHNSQQLQQQQHQHITSDQLRSSAKSLRSRRRSHSTNLLNDSASCVSQDDLSVDNGRNNSNIPMFEEIIEPNAPCGMPAVYADDDADHHHHRYHHSHNGNHNNNNHAYDHPIVTADDELSQGANKKKLFRPYYYSPRDFFSRLFLSSSMTNHNKSSSSSTTMKTPQFMTLMLLLAITCFVAGSYRQVLAATDLIEQVRMGESKLLVHLHKVEQQALQLAENLKRIHDRNDGLQQQQQQQQQQPQAGQQQQQQQPEQGGLDGDLIRVQVDKLRDMEAELDHEVRALRKKIQQSAKTALANTYGEGNIQVFMEVEVVEKQEDGSLTVVRSNISGNNNNNKNGNRLSIRLWYDTPHTGWTFLQQIERGQWLGATFAIQQGRALVAWGNKNRQRLQPSLDFLEPSERGHERYTVTLTDNSMSINLQDNRKFQHKQESCVGIIFEGFDVLHNMVRESSTGGKNRLVRIQKVSASHMTRAETAGLM